MLLALLSYSSASAETPPVPATFQDLYTELDNYLVSFNATLGSGNASAHPTLMTGSLKAANSNIGPQLLNGTTGMQLQLNALKAMGAQAIMVEVGFPMLYGPFLTSQGQPYSAFVAYYQGVATAVRQAGLKLIVENDTLLRNDVQAGWATAPFYATLDWTQYQQARAQTALTIAQTMRPDYMVVVQEPNTESGNSGQSEVDTPHGSAAMLSQILARVQQSGVPGLKVGAGTATSTVNALSFIQQYVVLPVDFIDLHIYPVNRNYLPSALQIASIAAAAGKPVSMTECWLWKARDSEINVLTPDQIRGRDPFNFWAPLDAHFIQTMQHLANHMQMLFLDPFDSEMYFAYQTYDDSTENLTPAQIIGQQNSLVSTANQQALYTGTGMSYYHSAILPAHTAPPSAPGELSGGLGDPATASLNWTASTDNIGVAGYYVLRDGQNIGTTGTLYYRDPGLTQATTYMYTVQAFDLAGNVSAASEPVNIQTSNATPPTTPGNVDTIIPVNGTVTAGAPADSLTTSQVAGALGYTPSKTPSGGAVRGASALTAVAAVNCTAPTGVTGECPSSATIPGLTVAGNIVIGATVLPLGTSNPKSPIYGATGNGLTDDTTALTSTFAGRLPVYLPYGIYMVSSCLSLPQYLHADPGTIIRAVPGSGSACVVRDTITQSTIENLTVDANHTATVGFSCYNCGNGTFTNIHAINAVQDGIRFDIAAQSPNGTNDNAHFIKPWAQFNARDGISTPTYQSDNNVIQIVSCYCANNMRHGLLLKGTVWQVIGGDFPGNGGYGISVAEDTDTTATEESLISFLSVESNALGTIYCSAQAAYSVYLVQQPLLSAIQSIANPACKDAIETNNLGQLVFAPAYPGNTQSFNVNSPITTTGVVTAPTVNSVQSSVNESATPSGTFSQTAATLENGSANTGTDLTVTSYGYVAVAFTASANDTIGSFALRLKTDGAFTDPTGTLNGYLYSDSRGRGPNTLLATSPNAIRLGSLTRSYQVLSFPVSYTATSGTRYWLVLKLSSAPAGADVIVDTGSVASGAATSQTGASSWTVTNRAMYFNVYGLTGYGIAISSTNNYGGYFVSTNNSGIYATSGGGIGVQGNSSNYIGGLFTSGNYYGVQATSTNSYGVLGSSTSNIGVYGSSSSSTGVYGATMTGSYGVYGTGGSTAGVYGNATGSGYGVYSNGPIGAISYKTASNCSSSASPGVCGSAAAGSVVVAAGATTVVVHTTAVTANSQIQLTFDSSLGAKLSVTCNTTPVQGTVSARTAGTSFTIMLPSAPTTKPACFSYSIVN
jgi:hypothetical protein